MRAKLRNLILLLLTATIAAADDYSMIIDSSEASNDVTLDFEEDSSYPVILSIK